MIFKIILCNNPKAVARCSRPLCSSQSTGGAPIHNPTRGKQKEVQRFRPDPKGSASGPSGPNSVQVRPPSPSPFQPPKWRTGEEQHPSHHVKCSTHELPAKNVCLRSGFWTPKSQMLLRKEVIQPHLPVRLPCYDLVLITDPTFDGSLHKG
jgi:hypothetical protein